MSRGSNRTPIFDREGGVAGSDAVLTVPNLITLARLLCVPVLLWMIHFSEHRYSAAWLFAALGATDWVDGYLARALDQRSQFGKVFDPTVDRLLFIVVIISMLIVEAAPSWFLLAILTREVAVALAALWLAARGFRTVDVSWWGKVATFGLLFTLPLLLAASAEPAGSSIYRATGWALGVPSLALSWYSAFGYLPLLRNREPLGD